MKKILLIEDNDEVRENTAEILELSNYRVLTAPNGKRGVELALSETPDLIICDIMMPELDGYGVLHALGKHHSTSTIPFIFLTAKSEQQDFRKGMGMGADDYITKPFDGVELLAAVETRLRKTEGLRHHSSDDKTHVNRFLQQARTAGATGLSFENAESAVYKKKHELYHEGQRPAFVYFVESGKVLVAKSNDDARQLVTQVCIKGDFFGFIDVLENSNYRESAEILEEAELLLIPRRDFNALISEDIHVAAKFIKMLAQDVTEREAKLLGLVYGSLRRKVAGSLLEVSGTGDHEKASFSISREQLARIAGSATESLIRTLSDFKEEKLIDIKGSSITILNRKGLERIIG